MAFLRSSSSGVSCFLGGSVEEGCASVEIREFKEFREFKDNCSPKLGELPVGLRGLSIFNFQFSIFNSSVDGCRSTVDVISASLMLGSFSLISSPMDVIHPVRSCSNCSISFAVFLGW